MDAELLSRMISGLLPDNDSVSLPGVGTFIAADVPATFSDKGFTINPPYRKLSFIPNETKDTLLADLYAGSNDIDPETAEGIIRKYLMEMKAALVKCRTFVLPGLGRLRMTRNDMIFFVPDEETEISSETFGLRPVSLKNHIGYSEPQSVETPAVEPQPEETAAVEPQSVEPAASEPQPVASELQPQPVEPSVPELQSVEPVASEPQPEEEPLPDEEPAIREEQTDIPVHLEPDWALDEEIEAESRRRPWLMLLAVIFAIAFIALVVFMIVARTSPDIIDTLLYTPEELRIIYY